MCDVIIQIHPNIPVEKLARKKIFGDKGKKSENSWTEVIEDI